MKNCTIYPIRDMLDYDSLGLTKQEWIVTQILSNILAKQSSYDGEVDPVIVDQAIAYTGCLIRKLEESNGR